MSHKVNLVRVLTAATGNSTPITLGAAYSQLFMTPAEAGAMNGRVYTYLIVDGNDWELGKGVYTSSGTTLARTTILASRISGTLGTSRISLSGTAQVRFVESAEDMDGVRGTRAVTGTSDVIANSDQGYVVTYSNAASVAVTLAQASASNLFLDGWATTVQNIGAGTVTITPATSTINGASTLVLAQNMGALIWSDGTNYHAYFAPVTKPLLAGNNLSDLPSATTALVNLGGTPSAAVAKSSNYTVVAGDAGSTIKATAALTLNLTAAATLGANFMFDVVNAASSNGVVTIDPNSSETINGTATLKIFPGERATIVCDGSNWQAFGLAPLVLLSTQVVAAASSISFVSLFDASFSLFEVRGTGLLAGSGNAGLIAQVSTNAGSTWLSGSTDYKLNYVVMDQGGTLSGGSSDDSSISICQISSGSMASFEMELFDFNSGTNYKTTQQRQAGSVAGGLRYMASSIRLIGANTSVVNGLRFSPSSSNVTGTFKLYGRR